MDSKQEFKELYDEILAEIKEQREKLIERSRKVNCNEEQRAVLETSTSFITWQTRFREKLAKAFFESDASTDREIRAFIQLDTDLTLRSKQINEDIAQLAEDINSIQEWERILDKQGIEAILMACMIMNQVSDYRESIAIDELCETLASKINNN